jgi:hypothetical protein
MHDQACPVHFDQPKVWTRLPALAERLGAKPCEGDDGVSTFPMVVDALLIGLLP